MSAFEFMGAHPILTFFLVLLICQLLWKVSQRFFRHLDISKHGWPTTPDMDADGDIVRPETPT